MSEAAAMVVRILAAFTRHGAPWSLPVGGRISGGTGTGDTRGAGLLVAVTRLHCCQRRAVHCSGVAYGLFGHRTMTEPGEQADIRDARGRRSSVPAASSCLMSMEIHHEGLPRRRDTCRAQCNPRVCAILWSPAQLQLWRGHAIRSRRRDERGTRSRHPRVQRQGVTIYGAHLGGYGVRSIPRLHGPPWPGGMRAELFCRAEFTDITSEGTANGRSRIDDDRKQPRPQGDNEQARSRREAACQPCRHWLSSGDEDLLPFDSKSLVSPASEEVR